MPYSHNTNSSLQMVLDWIISSTDIWISGLPTVKHIYQYSIYIPQKEQWVTIQMLGKMNYILCSWTGSVLLLACCSPIHNSI